MYPAAPATNPSQEAVQQASQRTAQAVQQAADAEQQARHERWLRDMERLRGQTELSELTAGPAGAVR